MKLRGERTRLRSPPIYATACGASSTHTVKLTFFFVEINLIWFCLEFVISWLGKQNGNLFGIVNLTENSLHYKHIYVNSTRKMSRHVLICVYISRILFIQYPVKDFKNLKFSAAFWEVNQWILTFQYRIIRISFNPVLATP